MYLNKGISNHKTDKKHVYEGIIGIMFIISQENHMLWSSIRYNRLREDLIMIEHNYVLRRTVENHI